MIAGITFPNGWWLVYFFLTTLHMSLKIVITVKGFITYVVHLLCGLADDAREQIDFRMSLSHLSQGHGL